MVVHDAARRVQLTVRAHQFITLPPSHDVGGRGCPQECGGPAGERSRRVCSCRIGSQWRRAGLRARRQRGCVDEPQRQRRHVAHEVRGAQAGGAGVPASGERIGYILVMITKLSSVGDVHTVEHVPCPPMAIIKHPERSSMALCQFRLCHQRRSQITEHELKDTSLLIMYLSEFALCRGARAWDPRGKRALWGTCSGPARQPLRHPPPPWLGSSRLQAPSLP